MAILVTGGAGYIGSHMAHALADRGERVVVLDDLSTGHRHAVPAAATLVVGDVGDIALVQSILKANQIREIVHFAARIVVVDSIAQPLDYYMNNTVRSRALFEAAVTSGIERLIFSSTAAVYGEGGTELIPETAEKRPITPYGRSKLATEWMLTDIAAAHGLSHAVLRYSTWRVPTRPGAAARPRAGRRTSSRSRPKPLRADGPTSISTARITIRPMAPASATMCTWPTSWRRTLPRWMA